MDCQNVKKSTSADRVAVFQDTQNWCETDPDLIAYIQKAKKATEIFYEDNYPAFNAANTRNQTITVTGERSFEAAMRLYKEKPGSKIAVMTDCLTLTLFADELWVYGDNNKLLSEGIMSEIYLWNLMKNKGSTFIPDTYSNKMVYLNSDDTFRYLENKMEDKFKKEISKNLLDKYKTKEHKTVYIGANFANFKHIDWARIHAYETGVCPISPQNILSYYLYKNSKSDGEYLKDRLALLKKSDKYWLCLDKSNFEKEINRLDQNTLAELYVLSVLYPEKEIEIIDWGKIGVPKYDKSKKWALTTKEQEEIINGVSVLKNNN